MTLQFMNCSHLIPFLKNLRMAGKSTDICTLSVSNSQLRVLLLKVKVSMKDLYGNTLVLEKFKSFPKNNQSN
jgi:hypothetical protein